MQTLSKILAVALLGLGSAGALAAGPAKAPARAPIPAAQTQPQRATLYFSVLVGALQSPKLEQPVKAALMGCIYSNSLGKITESMDKVIAENPGKIHRDNPGELLGVMVRICGYTPPAAKSGKAPGGR